MTGSCVESGAALPPGLQTLEAAASGAVPAATRTPPPELAAPAVDARLPFLRAVAILLPVAFLALALLLAVGPLHPALSSPPGFASAIVVLAAAATLFAVLVFAAIGRLQGAVLRQSRDLAALLDVGQRVTASLDPDEVMRYGVLAVAASGKADAVELWTVDRAGARVLLRKRHGGNGATLFERTVCALGEGVPGTVAASGETWTGEAPSEPAHGSGRGALSARAAFPLRCAHGVNGVLVVASASPLAFQSAAALRILGAMADRIALALDNANLHEQVQARAAITERERIARELHDGMAQILTYIGAKTHAVERLLARGQAAEAQRQLSEMAGVSRALYAEVREAILALRTGIPDGGNLVAILEKYLAELQNLSGLALHLDVEAPPGGLPLPPSMAEVQVLRIIQEALSNVRQHARATQATVRLRADGDGLEITVSDDGRGFDPGRLGPGGRPRFGLQSMDERARATGGSLAVSSAHGGGTTVTLRVPVAREVEA